jgi:hypothetical protein
MEESQSDKENKNNVQIEEHSTYPLDSKILYKERVNGQTKRSFNYIILKEGVYPDEIITRPKNKKQKLTNNTTAQRYKIPHGYVVETTWGRATKKQTVRCEIDYINKIPQFKIKYGSNFQHVVLSNVSPSTAAFNYEKVSKYYYYNNDLYKESN